MAFDISDDELVKLLKMGNHRAFDKIYLTYRKPMYAIAYAKVKDQQISEDIVQEIFLSLWTRRNELEINNLQGYLLTSVKYLTLTYMHRHLKHDAPLPSETDEVTQRSVADPESIYHSKYLDHLYRFQIDQLPLQCRLVFTYSRIEGLKIPEIASRMGVTEKNVEQHLTKALKRLGKWIRTLPMLLYISALIFFYFFLRLD